ncbi:hypothetical protein ACM9HO_03045 [Pseudomonas sp. KHB2.9]
MTQHTGHIKNPLTVISVFAGIAEISGTVVLPFIAAENQATYIWFLMLFPPFLVGIFFATLNWNHRTLYAPSDYQNEDNFVNSVGRSTSIERVIKLNEEVEDIVADVSSAAATVDAPQLDDPAMNSSIADLEAKASNEPSTLPQDSDHNLSKSGGAKETPAEYHSSTQSLQENKASKNLKSPNNNFILEKNRITSDLRLIEELAIKKITKLTGHPFMKGMKIINKSGEALHFDAGVVEKDHFYALEVKYHKGQTFNISRLKVLLNRCQKIVTEDDFFSKRFTLHLVIVTPSEGTIARETLTNLLSLTNNLDYVVEFHMLTTDDLIEN